MSFTSLYKEMPHGFKYRVLGSHDMQPSLPIQLDMKKKTRYKLDMKNNTTEA